MYTEEQFFVYLQQFERDFAASRAKVIDATEGGAGTQGVQTMTLCEAIDAFLSTQSSTLTKSTYRNPGNQTPGKLVLRRRPESFHRQNRPRRPPAVCAQCNPPVSKRFRF